MPSTSPTRTDSGQWLVADTRAPVFDRVLRQAKLVFFFAGLLLLFAGWSMGNQAIANQNIAIARGFTAPGLLIAGGLAFVAAAIVFQRDATGAENRPN